MNLPGVARSRHRAVDSIMRSQMTHVRKALSEQPIPPKQKHVRAIILETYDARSSRFYFSTARELPLSTNPVVCWKFLVVLHKILRGGHPQCIKDAIHEGNHLISLLNLWQGRYSDYETFIVGLMKALLQKLKTHKLVSVLPGNMEVSAPELIAVMGPNLNRQYEVCGSFLDYQDTLLSFLRVALEWAEKGRTSFASSQIYCRLIALVQVIQDCAALYDLIIESLFNLHTNVDHDILGMYRDRFVGQYEKMKKYFDVCGRINYLKSLITVPVLTGGPPNFLDVTSRAHHQNLVVTVNEDDDKSLDESTMREPSPTHLIEVDTINPLDSTPAAHEPDVADKFDAIFGPSTAAQFTFNGSSNPPKQPENHEYIMEIEMLKSEIRRLQHEHIEAGTSLYMRIRQLEDEIKDLVQRRSQYEEEISRIRGHIQETETSASSSSDKFNKLRDAYSKLREEHLVNLRRVGTLQKELADGKDSRLQALTQAEADSRTAREQLGRLEVEAQQNSLAEAHRLYFRLVRQSCQGGSDLLRSNMTTLRGEDLVSCRSSAEFLLERLQVAYSNLTGIETSSRDCNQQHPGELVVLIAQFGCHLSEIVIHGKATSQSAASVEKSDELVKLCKNCGEEALTLFGTLPNDLEQGNSLAVISGLTLVRRRLDAIRVLTEELKPKVLDVGEEEMTSLLDKEMAAMTALIANAELQFKNLLEKSKNSMTGIQLEVHSQILDSCTDLMAAIRLLVAKARELQNEIVTGNRGTATVKEFYKKHNRWTEGLLSAAKAVGASANLLMESADLVVAGNGGKLEHLMVAAQEIAASTTQLIVASRVKANTSSAHLMALQAAGRDVSKATGAVVAGAKSAVNIREQTGDMGFASLTFTQARRAEVDLQANLLSLEANLATQRKRLAELRRKNYATAAETEERQ